ncbi:MAG: hypothetical protein NUV77_19450 [Thermoguttaceae bacterium]|jgi:hypothetical protein|nr:hypothetical protein [Thermoguttaceae bacterium]
MPAFLSLADIEACFANQWVLIGEPQVSELLVLEGGRVLCHSPDRKDVEGYLATQQVAQFVLMYMGRQAPAEEMAFLPAYSYPLMPGAESRRALRGGLTGWLVALALAGMVYFGTTDPSLGVAAACVKAGWNELCSGCWLYRSDPLRRRAQACFWFYLAASLWKIWASAVAAMMVCVAILHGKQAAPPEFIVAASTMAIALGLTVVVGWIAIPVGMKAGVRVWVEPRIWKKCAGDFAQVSHIARKLAGRNYALLFVVTMSIELPVIVLGLLAVWFIASAGDPGQIGAVECVVSTVALWSPMLAIPIIAALLHRIQACQAVECWPLGLIGMERIIPTTY